MTNIDNTDSICRLQNDNMEDLNKRNETEKNEKKNQSRNPFIIIWRTVQQWAEDTGFHCVKYVLGKKFNIVRRLFWLVVIGFMWYALVVSTMTQIDRFSSFKPITRETIRLEQQLEFPAVTICTPCLLHGTNRTDPLDTQIIAAAMNSLYSGNLTYTFGNISYKHMKIHEMRFNMSIPGESLFYTCLWRGERFDCMTHMKPHFVVYQFCYTFNYNESPDKFVSKATGSYSGLYMMLFLEQENCFDAGRFNAAGVQIMIHDATEEPDFNLLQTNLAPGFHHSIGVTKHEKKLLPSPVKAFGDTECLDTSGNFTNPLQYFPHYSMQACEQECYTNFVNRTCQCVLSMITETLQICDFQAEVECAIPAYYEFEENWLEHVHACGCLVSCSYNTYSTRVSSLYIPDKTFILPPKQYGDRELNYSDKEYIRENYLSVEVFYDTKLVPVTEQILEFTLEDLGAAFGGLLGLALGASWMTIVELLEMIIIAIVRVCRGLVCRRRTQSVTL